METNRESWATTTRVNLMDVGAGCLGGAVIVLLICWKYWCKHRGITPTDRRKLEEAPHLLGRILK